MDCATEGSCYENKDSAYVVEGRLKVLLEQDYLALEKGTDNQSVVVNTKETNKLGSEIMRKVVIPILEKEVNEGKNFAQLRQVYNSLILAIWFKDKIKESLFGKAYVDQKKTGGVDIEDKTAKDKIWLQYVKAFKKGAYNYIKEDYDPITQQTMPRKYFSGGAGLYQIRTVYSKTVDSVQLPQGISDQAMVVKVEFNTVDSAMKIMESVVYPKAGLIEDEQNTSTVLVDAGLKRLKFSGWDKPSANPFTIDERAKFDDSNFQSEDLSKMKKEDIKNIRQSLYDRSSGNFIVLVIVTDTQDHKHYYRILGKNTTEMTALRQTSLGEMKVKDALMQISAANQGDQPGNFTLISEGDRWRIFGAVDEHFDRPHRVMVQYKNGSRSVGRIQVVRIGDTIKVYLVDDEGYVQFDKGMPTQDIDFILAATPLFWEGKTGKELLQRKLHKDI